VHLPKILLNFQALQLFYQWEMLGIEFPDNLNINKKTKGKLIYPDGDDSLAYIVFKNYERLLHWNRSLRFAICIGVFSDLVKS
jgi:membrane-bound lytic murein transglycosylase B